MTIVSDIGRYNSRLATDKPLEGIPMASLADVEGENTRSLLNLWKDVALLNIKNKT